MGFLRVIIWGLIFYVLYKTAVKVMKIFADNRRSEQVDDSMRSKYSIKKDDIIEAKFEDIAAQKKDEPSR